MCIRGWVHQQCADPGSLGRDADDGDVVARCDRQHRALRSRNVNDVTQQRRATSPISLWHNGCSVDWRRGDEKAEKEGRAVALCYLNFAQLHQARGDTDAARAATQKGDAMFKAIGAPLPPFGVSLKQELGLV